jgi:hypothetical protein
VKTRTLAILSIGLTAAASAGLWKAVQVHAGDIPSPTLAARQSWAETEVARVRAHLLRVEKELRSADVSHLGAQQRAHRSQLIEELKRYRERGLFPHNHVVAERATPVFIDEHGTHCAVGHLMAQSGHEALAQRISASRNLVRAKELADTPEVVAWLEEAGLSLDEAARIQPAYGGFPPREPVVESDTYAYATLVGAGLGTVTTVWNVVTDRKGKHWWIPGALGLGLGVSQSSLAIYGAVDDNGGDDADLLAIGVNAAVGLVSGIAGIRTLSLGRNTPPPVGNSERNEAANLTLMPWTPRGSAAGVRVTMRF